VGHDHRPADRGGRLQNGEIDLIEQPAHDLLPIMEADENIVLFDQNPLGNQYMFRFNSLHPPFNDPEIRRAALLSMKQEDFLNAVIGDPKYYKTCAAMFVCGTTFATDKGGEVWSSPTRRREGAPEGGRLRRHARSC
jgi:peptide/nickel transport system substrate-binding protein